MDYRKLADELATDPAALGYAGKTDAQATALMNAAHAGSTVYRAVTTKEVYDALTSATITGLVDASVTATPPAKHEAAQALDSYLSGAGEIDVKDGTPGARVFSELVAAGLLVAADVARIKAIGTVLRSRAAALGLDAVTARDVGVARGGQW